MMWNKGLVCHYKHIKLYINGKLMKWAKQNYQT